MSLSNKMTLKENVGCGGREFDMKKCNVMFLMDLSGKRLEWYLYNKRHFGFMLNVDWFYPYRHVKNISIGVIYLVCLNLPKSERFNRNNVLLIGIIPSMKK